MKLTPSDWAAWWGAVVGTLAIAWEIWTFFKSGPRVKFTAKTGMQVYGHPELEGKTLTIFEATNLGDRPTMLTKLYLMVYRNRFAMIFGRKPKTSYLIKNPGWQSDQTFPHKLDVEELWHGTAFENSEHLSQLPRGRVYAYLECSYRTRPVRCFVRKVQK